MDLNGLPQTVQNFINDTIQYRESGNCLDYDTCQKILEYAADTGSQKLTGLGLYYLAECYWQKGEYENTMQCLTEGVGCLENARMYELLAKAHNMMGAVSDRKNNRMLALSSYYNSLKYAEKYHFYYIQGMAESNIAYTLVRMRLRQEAIQHYRIAIACYDKSEKTYQLNYNRINCMIECGCCHMYLGEMEEALQLWNEIEKILREAPESYYSKITLEMYRIPCELLKGHEEEALKLASDLLEQLSDRDVFEEIMDELVILAGILAILPDGKYLEELKTLWEGDKLIFHGTSEKFRNHYAFKELLDACYGTEWVPYCKKTFHGAQSVIKYLGKYTHRIAISNHRIIRMDEETVTFSVKDYRNEGRWKELTLSGIEFIRRFLMHVPPKGFVRIRHYGLLCSRSKNKKLTLCRNLLGCKKYFSRLKNKEMPEVLELLYGINICVCKACGGRLGKPQLKIPQRC